MKWQLISQEGHLSCHEFLLWTQVASGHPGSILSFFGSASGFAFWEFILPQCAVLVGLLVRTAGEGTWLVPRQSSPYFQGFESWMEKPSGTYLLQQQHTNRTVGSVHLDPPSFHSVCFHQAWFCTLPVDSLSYLDALPTKSFALDLTKISVMLLAKTEC